MFIESIIRIEKSGFDYFLNSSEDKINSAIVKTCRATKEDQKCARRLMEKFRTFKSDYISHNQKPSLDKFKNFLTSYFKSIKSSHDLAEIFGAENIFTHGQIRALSSDRNQFVTTFSTGQFRGLGVIDNFKRSSGIRTPASIRSE